MKATRVRKKATLCIATSIMLLSMSCADNPETNSTPQQTQVAEDVSSIAQLSDFKWLAGRWEHAMADATAFEEWTQADDGSLKGKGGYVKGTDTMTYEVLSIERSGDDILYIPTVMDQNDGKPVPFSLTMAANDSFVFENPAHDFPTKITYVRLTDNKLVATISGEVNGAAHSEQFELTRVK